MPARRSDRQGSHARPRPAEPSTDIQRGGTTMISRRKFGALAGTAAVTAGVSSPAAAQQAQKWKMQSLWQAGTVNQKVFEDFCIRVKAMTNGRLEIEPLAVGT